jgi:transposase-like protein
MHVGDRAPALSRCVVYEIRSVRGLKKTESLYHAHCFPAMIIRCAVRWYGRFNLSLRGIGGRPVSRDIAVVAVANGTDIRRV